MHARRGFTLIELLITVAVLAIIAAIAYPSFASYLMKSKRIEAIQTLYRMQLRQEEWRISNPAYTSAAENLISPTENAHYGFSTSTSGAGYTLTATAKSGSSQQNDKEGGTPCNVLTLDRNSNKTPDACWR
ncbi:type IV pilin [Zobellella denitrificans]|jgi:type IV pilus assembly protein PilE|uniref:Type IV pilin n=1 Tax=Zobellella denitrificans TaxID=347534 RepID=A0A231N0F6_9GAMM|nr:type IV pilin protein [Zobellella denitrificans]ATG72915.1 type IV pilin [Zobellella denitrificans]OXS15852.1 type IV pilin [Zobellella denitrificans]